MFKEQQNFIFGWECHGMSILCGFVIEKCGRTSLEEEASQCSRFLLNVSLHSTSDFISPVLSSTSSNISNVVSICWKMFQWGLGRIVLAALRSWHNWQRSDLVSFVSCDVRRHQEFRVLSCPFHDSPHCQGYLRAHSQCTQWSGWNGANWGLGH